MFNMLKPYVGPVALVVLERGLDASGLQVSPFWAGALVSFAVFWFFFALVSHKDLVRRFPGIRTWLPFVDPTFSVRAEPKELTGRYIVGQHFQFADIALDGSVRNRTFEDCVIYGPAVLGLQGVGMMHECIFEQPIDALLIRVNQPRMRGVIPVEHCTFRRCTFRAIGFVGTPEIIKGFEADFARQTAAIDRAPSATSAKA